MTKPDFTWATTILCVSDMPKSLAYYRDVLGFDISWQWGDDGFEGQSHPTFAAVNRGDVTFFLCENGQGNPGSWVCVNVANRDDLDSLHQQYQASGADLKSEPEDCPWGMREFHVCDLDGNTFRMGCAIDDCD